MTESLLAAVRAYSDACNKMETAGRALIRALQYQEGPIGALINQREQRGAEWRAARDEVVEAAQQWAAHYG